MKKKLLEENDLHTIVRLPKDVFAPYTNINTNPLFFRKGRQTKGVWFYRLEMPAGYKHFSKTRPMLDTHFDPVCAWWDARIESEVSQYVSVEDIIAGDYKLKSIADSENVKYLLKPYTGNWDGALAFDGDKRAILVNTTINNHASHNFTFAHEFWHYFLNHQPSYVHDGHRSIRCTISETDLEQKGREREATRFAVELLN